METILSFHVVWLVLLFAAIPFASAALMHWATQHTALGPVLQPYGGVVGPFFVSVGLLFGLFATFLAADIWERVNVSNQSLEQEVGAIQTIRQISDVLGEPGQTIDDAIKDYTEIALLEEWSNDKEPRSVAADASLGRLVRAILDLPVTVQGDAAAQDVLLTCFHEIREARATRIHIASSHSDPYKWATVIVLGILTQISLVFCHVRDRKAQFAALILFSIGFAVTLVVLGVHERPLADPKLVSLKQMHRLAE